MAIIHRHHHRTNSAIIDLLRYVVFLAVPLVNCDDQMMKSTYFRSVTWPNGTKLCALGDASQSVTAKTVVECSNICKKATACGNFNFDRSSGLCTLYSSRPSCYGYTSGSCTHYELDSYSNKPDTGIADKDCHIPFTYEKRLYLGCGSNLTGDGCMYCLNDNWTLVRCQQPATFVAQSIQTTISIPTFAQPVPVISINRWIVFLYRYDGSLSFNETWINYRNGFGNLSEEFWLGLEKVHQMTNSGQCRVRFELKSIQNESWFSAEYSSFQIDPESKFYTIHTSGYAGDSGILFEIPNPAGVQNGMNFTTWDSDNDRAGGKSCAVQGGGGYWYNNCGGHALTNLWGTTYFYSRRLVDNSLASDSRLDGVRVMVQCV